MQEPGTSPKQCCVWPSHTGDRGRASPVCAGRCRAGSGSATCLCGPQVAAQVAPMAESPAAVWVPEGPLARVQSHKVPQQARAGRWLGAYWAGAGGTGTGGSCGAAAGRRPCHTGHTRWAVPPNALPGARQDPATGLVALWARERPHPAVAQRVGLEALLRAPATPGARRGVWPVCTRECFFRWHRCRKALPHSSHGCPRCGELPLAQEGLSRAWGSRGATLRVPCWQGSGHQGYRTS